MPLFRDQWRVVDGPMTALVVATLAMGFFFGGSPIGPGPALLAFVATGLITLVVAVLRGALRVKVRWTVRVFVLLVAIFPFLQVVPLPYGVWMALPGHEVARASIEAAGLAGHWLPWSVAPLETLICCLLVFPLLGVFLGTMLLGDDDVDLVFLAIGIMALVGLCVGVIQVATAGTQLRFYERADHRYLLGFFTNKNHSATFLTAGLLILTYFIHRLPLAAATRWLTLGGATVLVFAAILATNSRAGLALGGLAALWCAASLLAHRAIKVKWLVLGMAAAMALGVGLVSASSVAGRSVQRYGEIGNDRRWTIWTDTMVATREYFPLGSGMGSFVPVYRTAEPLASVNPRYANRAHNDYLELALEGGLPVIALIVAFLGLWGRLGYGALTRAAARAPRQRRGRPTGAVADRCSAQALVGGGTILLILLHSIMDYPLRTMIWSALTAFSFALLVRVAPTGHAVQDERRGSSGTPDDDPAVYGIRS